VYTMYSFAILRFLRLGISSKPSVLSDQLDVSHLKYSPVRLIMPLLAYHYPHSYHELAETSREGRRAEKVVVVKDKVICSRCYPT